MSRFPHSPFLWPKGRTREIVADAHRVGLEGWFTVSLIHARSGLIARELHFRNLIVDGGRELLGTSTLDTALAYFAVGTSSTAPATGQTTLGAEVFRTNSTGGFADTAGVWSAGNIYLSAKRTRVFTEAQANGNLTEVGILNAATAGTMFCRSLLKDAGGFPTTITKTSEFQLRIEYEVRLYPPNGWGDYTFDTLVNGVSRTLTARPLGASNILAWHVFNFGGAPDVGGSPVTAVNNSRFNVLTTDATLRTADAVALTAAVAATSRVNTAYGAGALYREQTQDWSGAVANTTNYFLWGWNGQLATFQALFPVALTKTNVQKFVIVARSHWDRRP